LRLEDGTEYQGWSFGAQRPSSGEVVFTTSMAGYPQSLTDPSYHGQIIVATYPLIGNYGVPSASFDAEGISRSFESDRIWASGLVVSEACSAPSHHASGMSLSSWLEGEGVPGIEGLDTRELTIRLREHGTMRGTITVDGAKAAGDSPWRDISAEPSVAEVSASEVSEYGSGRGPRIALVDCGVKNNILRCFLARGATVLRVPWNRGLDDLDYDGLFISNGPGDPKACSRAIALTRRALSDSRPVFGVCLGAQILALAAGADTYKLPYGHRGQNQPCVEIGTGRCYVTSQNHGYAVRAASLPAGWEVWFENGNDGTVEGLRSTRGPYSAVQFHPEGCPGPRDTEFLFDRFVAEAAAAAAGERRSA
jgi:carbamoyl-phosphate synthase small subunit